MTPDRAIGLTRTVLLVLGGVLIGFVLVEACYRAYLYRTETGRFVELREDEEHPDFWYLQDSPYRYSEEFGYEYVPGEFDGGYVQGGRVTECFERLWVNNERGNSGRIKGTYDGADLKILVFGNSWTQAQAWGPGGDLLTWPNLLQDLLEHRLGTSVHVVNFGRDGYGILQMFDLAAAKVPEWKPDLVIFAFITDDLSRDRFWRTKVTLDGRERNLVSVTPDPQPDWSTASDLDVIDSRATRAWCRRVRDAHALNDPIVLGLEQAVSEARRRSRVLATPFSLTQSFVADLLLRGDPFWTTLARTPPSQWPHHALRDFSHDSRMVSNVETLLATEVPLVLIHLAFHGELEAEREYLGVGEALAQSRALVESLGRMLGRPVYETLDHVALPVRELGSLCRGDPRDHHPSLAGMRFYAEMVAEVLVRQGELSRAEVFSARH